VIRTAAALLLVGLVVAGDAASTAGTSCPAATGFARLAYVRAGALRVLEMPACSTRVLVPRGAGAPVRWSADGRYVSFSGGVIAAAGGRVHRGLHGAWAPRGHALATLTEAGGVILGGPGLPERQLVPDGFGAQSISFDPGGRLLAVGRATPSELVIVDLRTGARRVVYRPDTANPRAPVVTHWAPGGFVLFRLAVVRANSANLDGLPLLAVSAGGGQAHRVLEAALSYDEFFARCARGVAVAAGGDRFTTRAKRLVLVGPPGWRGREISRDPARSWVSPACSPDGRSLAASAGRSWVETRFGLERRSIWSLSADGHTRRRLTEPPRGRSDELPRWSDDGRTLFFVRSGPTTLQAAAPGSLFVVRLDGRLAGPIVELGTTRNYYGRYGWAEQTDLFIRRGNQSARR
jgi:dipeptidyl aminopeptidase/acylaminoacyl peptidase